MLKYIQELNQQIQDYICDFRSFGKMDSKQDSQKSFATKSLNYLNNLQVQSKNKIIKQSMTFLSKTRSDLNSKSQRFITELANISSEFTKINQEKFDQIKSFLQTHETLTQERCSLTSEITQFTHKMTSKYTSALSHHSKTLSKITSKLSILHYIHHSHLQDEEMWEGFWEDCELRRRKEEEGEGVDWEGCRVVVKKVTDVSEESGSGLVVPMCKRANLGYLANEFGNVKVKAGEEFDKACEIYVKEHESLAKGDAVVLPSGGLRFDKIIAAHCPEYVRDQNKGNIVYFLKRTIERVLCLSTIYQLKSIVIPSFCSEVSKIPIELYSCIVIKTVKDYINAYSNIMEGKTVTICYSKLSDQEYFTDAINNEDLQFPEIDFDQQYYESEKEERLTSELESQQKIIAKMQRENNELKEENSMNNYIIF
ncbi:unnamed protein product [Moneuplotes crassus]|uniref:Macro domain-containing protein n=1 Tax=Euplotes crassus TaxID=5936 RepID=A0AAD2D4A2_EUPCR|nr:unnamed protein product [Moneuplotes crassus]